MTQPTLFNLNPSGLTPEAQARYEGNKPADSKAMCAAILRLLRTKEWVSLPELLHVCPASYRQRISDLRKGGHRIEHRRKGTQHFYRLVERKTRPT